ncbi:MAG TPA: Ig-like domain-containing protein [Acidimicrobiales bacterium]|jgi:lipoprotein-anchoring transpeptidase ErfK/SrfK|nr:Ig-like domain-containing protein [Acidimicrobiales bacterium]
MATGCSSSGGGVKVARTTTTAPAALVTVTPAGAATGVALDAAPNVIVEHGRITNVALAAPGGQPVPGQISPDQHTWKASPGVLVPSTTYSGTVSVRGDNGKTIAQPWSFTTSAPARELHTDSVNVWDGGVYGVGMPIIVRLNTAIPQAKRAELEQRITVTGTPTVTGAWRWFSDTELHWRPQNYWTPGTNVTVDINFAGFDVDGQTWGVDGRKISFAIGDSHISVVDAATHQMVVRTNGAVVKTMPVSTGRDKYPTKSGIHVINERAQKVIMDSATVGIPRNSPDGYYETVYWNVRISNSGEFVHAAPWSVGSQGRSNVSHGCVNVSTANAEWFFNYSRVGDVVQVVNTPEQLQPSNGYGDWQIPWAQWAS